MENSEKKQPHDGEGREKYSPVAYLIVLFAAAIVLVLLSYFVYEKSEGKGDTELARQQSEMTVDQAGNIEDVE